MEIGSVRQIVEAVNPAAPVAPSERPAQQREMIEAIKAVNAAEMFGAGNELTFVFDRYSRTPLLRIVNRETREIVQQIPAEYLLRLARELKVDNSFGHRG